MAMGKSNFPKKQSKLHDPVYAKKGMKPPEERYRNSKNNKLRMFANRIAKWRAK